MRYSALANSRHLWLQTTTRPALQSHFANRQRFPKRLNDFSAQTLYSVATHFRWKHRWPIPRLVCVLPAPEKGREPLTEIDRSFEKWSALLDGWVRSGKKGGRRCATRELRVFFLCPQDMSLAECGRGGQGYEVGSRRGALGTCSWEGSHVFTSVLLCGVSITGWVGWRLPFMAPRARCHLGGAFYFLSLLCRARCHLDCARLLIY